jgi:hypothetical protein
MNVSEAHNEGKNLKKVLTDNFSEDIVFTLHTDDCRHMFCSQCKKNDCKERKTDFVSLVKWNLETITIEHKE